ncbi:MAG: efflux RND transporter periplasmic adaptor subunit [Planctomycetaceae bacterium]|nr:efflux RND transporter periplasmic adaptor subunit [Planctomycetaceae bacterium]
MKILSSTKHFLASSAGRATSLSIAMLVGVVAVVILFFPGVRSSEGSGDSGKPILNEAGAPQTTSERMAARSLGTGQPPVVGMGGSEAFGLETAPVKRDRWPETVRVTGRLELNASRVAHVSSLVDGVIREVRVELGQTVEQGDVLAYIDSREVGEAKLQLVKDKLQLASARTTSQWHDTIHENTVALLEMLQEGVALDEIETAFQERPVGEHREHLVSALSRLNRVAADFDRVRRLGADAVIPEKEVIRARAEHEAAAATYQALKEQIRFEAQQRATEARQQLQAAEAAVAVGRSHLLILGYRAEEIDSMDPIGEAERVAYYPVRAPIGGTVIGRNAPLSQHVNEQTELIRIADLSTVWLRADIFEKHIQAVQGLQQRSVTFTTGGYPGRSFDATVFSLGDLVAEESRAAPLLAVAENPDGLLKPGMFAEIELTARDDADVLQVPDSAIQRHAGATFVFVADGSGGFERRDVEVGRSTARHVEILAGVGEGELAVVQGGFALKSEMLSELMVEE